MLRRLIFFGSITSYTNAVISPEVLQARSEQLAPHINTGVTVSAELLEARSVYYGSHTETANGITLEQGYPAEAAGDILEPIFAFGIPVYVAAEKLVARAEQFAPSVILESLVSPATLLGTAYLCESRANEGITLSPDALSANAALQAPTIVTTIKPSIMVGLQSANVVQLSPAVVAEFSAELLAARAVIKTPAVSAGVTVSADVLQANLVFPVPTVRYEYAVSVECLDAVGELLSIGTGAEVNVDLDFTLYGKAILPSFSVSASTTVSVDCLSAVVEFYGTHVETANGLTLEQQAPIVGGGRIHSPTISVGTPQQIQTVLIEVLEVQGSLLSFTLPILVDCLSGVALHYGSHTSTDITISPLEPLGANPVCVLIDEINVNTEYSHPVSIGSSQGEIYANLYGVHTSTDITLIANSDLPVHAVQYEPVIGNWKNATIAADLLLGNGIQKQTAIVAGGGVVVDVDMLTATADQQTAIVTLVKAPVVSVDLLAGKGTQESPTLAFDYIAVAEKLIGLASLKTPTLVPHIKLTVTVSALEAWGGLQSPTIGEAREITVLVGWMPAIGILRDPTIGGVFNPVVLPDRLIGTGIIPAVPAFVGPPVSGRRSARVTPHSAVRYAPRIRE